MAVLDSPSSSSLGHETTITKFEDKEKKAKSRAICTMAPGFVDPPQAAPASNVAKGAVGPKEAFIGGPQVFNKIAEERGTEKQPPATHPRYLPVWDADTKYVPATLHHWSRFCFTDLVP